jgi:hypothetical protein
VSRARRRHPTVARRLFVLLAIALPATAGPAVRAQPRPPRWPDGTRILVWTDRTHAPSGAEALVERAVENWSRAAEGRVTLTTTPSIDAASVRVHFMQSDTNFGETAPRVDGTTGAIVGADVAIRGEAESNALGDRIVMYLTALHELGHALGLPHSDDFGAIMYRFRAPTDSARYFTAYRQRLGSLDEIGTASATGISASDLQALRTLYTH